MLSRPFIAVAIGEVLLLIGYANQGAGYGYSRVKGINALIATLSTPAAAPVILASRLRKGSTNSARGAARLVAHALATAARAGVCGLVILRADSAYYDHGVIAAAIRAGARFSVTAGMNPAVRRAIASIDEAAWIPIHYPNAVWDEDEQRLVSDAEVAEIGVTAFTSRRNSEHIDGRLIVRRVKRRNSWLPWACRIHRRSQSNPSSICATAKVSSSASLSTGRTAPAMAGFDDTIIDEDIELVRRVF